MPQSTNILTKIVKNLFLSNAISKRGTFTRNPYPAHKFTNFYLKTSDNIKIGCWLLESNTQKVENALIILHGNASNREGYCTSFGISRILARGYAVLLPDYRGFGDSEGEFEIETVNYDIEACVQYMKNKYGMKPHICGYSLGGAVALEYVKYVYNKNNQITIDSTSIVSNTIRKLYAEDRDFDKIFLMSTFSCTIDVLREQVLYLLATFIYPFADEIIENEFNYDNLKNIRYLNRNDVIIFHGRQDELVPFWQGEILADEIECEIHVMDVDNHFSLMYNYEVWEIIDNFLLFSKNK